MNRAYQICFVMALATQLAGTLSAAAAATEEFGRFGSFHLGDMAASERWPDAARAWDADDPDRTPAGDCPTDVSAVTPRWSASAGVLALHRQRPDSALLFFNFFDGTQALDAASFDFGYKPAWELSLARQISDAFDVEFRYLGGDAWTARSRAVTDPADPLVINARIPVFLPSGRTIDATYGSDLRSFEFNLRTTPCGCVTWLVGLRYVALDEAFRADLVDSTAQDPNVAYVSATRNGLYGGQIGADATLLDLGQRLRLDLSGKAGVFGNSNGQRSYLDTGLVRVHTGESADTTSFLGEAQMSLVYSVTTYLSLRLSYGVVWLTDVALATEQLNATSFFSRDGIRDDGDVFYHGGFLGLEYGF